MDAPTIGGAAVSDAEPGPGSDAENRAELALQPESQACWSPEQPENDEPAVLPAREPGDGTAQSAAQALPPEDAQAASESRRESHRSNSSQIPGEPMQRVQSGALAMQALGDAARVRACSVWDVMASMGSVLTDNAVLTSQIHRKISKPVECLDAFLSHSWRHPRRRKFMQLALLYNLWPAMTIGLLGSCIGFVLHWTGIVPLLTITSKPLGYAGFLLGSVLYVVTFHCWGEVMRLRFKRLSSPLVFLDKYCINQEDYDEKKQGIKALGSTIVKSKQLVVLHNSTYFSRLWTVYEISCFMSAHSMNRLTLVPDMMPTLVINSIACVFLGAGISKYLQPVVEAISGAETVGARAYLIALVVATVIAIAGLVVTQRKWLEQVHGINETLRRFKIQEAECFDERDRPLVYKHVADLEKSLGLLGERAGEEEALASFNARVQEHLAPTVTGMLTNRTPYHYAVAMCLPIFLRTGDVLAAVDLNDQAWIDVAVEVMFTFFITPVTFKVIGSLCQRKLHLRSNLKMEALWCALLVVTVELEYIVMGFSARIISISAKDSTAALAVFAVYFGLLAAATVWMYSDSGSGEATADARQML